MLEIADPVKALAAKLLPEAILEKVRKRYYYLALKEFREEAERDMAVVRHLVRAGDVAVDLGANIGRIAFIKCDVEGHEWSCVRGARQVLEKHSPRWLIEIGDDPDVHGSNGQGLLEAVGSLGYGTYWFDGATLRRRRPGDTGWNYFLLKPNGRGRSGAAGCCTTPSAPATRSSWSSRTASFPGCIGRTSATRPATSRTAAPTPSAPITIRPPASTTRPCARIYFPGLTSKIPRYPSGCLTAVGFSGPVVMLKNLPPGIHRLAFTDSSDFRLTIPDTVRIRVVEAGALPIRTTRAPGAGPRPARTAVAQPRSADGRLLQGRPDARNTTPVFRR